MAKPTKIPVIVCEYHQEVLQYIHRLIARKKLPFNRIKMLHFDSHPDLSYPDRLSADDCYSKEKMYYDLDIADWILPLMYAGHLDHLIWVKPPWADQIPEKRMSFAVGKGSECGKLRVTCTEDYFLEDCTFTSRSKLTNVQDVTVESIGLQSLLSKVHLEKNSSSTGSPFQQDSSSNNETLENGKDSELTIQTGVHVKTDKPSSHTNLKSDNLCSDMDVKANNNISSNDIKTDKPNSHINLKTDNLRSDMDVKADKDISSNDVKTDKPNSHINLKTDNLCSDMDVKADNDISSNDVKTDKSRQCIGSKRVDDTNCETLCGNSKAKKKIYLASNVQRNLGDSAGICHLLSSERYILDIDLDFFSVTNPFLQDYTELQYNGLREVYSLTFPSCREDDVMLDDCVSTARMHLGDLKKTIESFHTHSDLSETTENATFLKLLRSIKEQKKDVDWEMVHSAGMTTELPHHISSVSEIDDLIEQMVILLKQLPLPAAITVARSTVDEYCPPEQIGMIQEKVISALQLVYSTQCLEIKYDYSDESRLL